MKKFLTKRDIMELLCISKDCFQWYRNKLEIKGEIVGGNQLCYTIQDMLDIYCASSKKQKEQIFESKMNFKEMPL